MEVVKISAYSNLVHLYCSPMMTLGYQSAISLLIAETIDFRKFPRVHTVTVFVIHAHWHSGSCQCGADPTVSNIWLVSSKCLFYLKGHLPVVSCCRLSHNSARKVESIEDLSSMYYYNSRLLIGMWKS